MKRVLVAVCLTIVLWGALDLGIPSTTHLRDFDAKEVARIETEMWRAYYEHHSLLLFHYLGELLRDQYGLSRWKSNLGAYYAARAAVVFQRGKSRSDYEQALPYLRHYYAMIRRGSDIAFDANRAAELELEWWIAHRDRRADLPQTLGALQSELYQSRDTFEEHAAARAQAMIYRDEKGSSITNEDWRRIQEWLLKSWTSLQMKVRQL